MSTCYGDTAQNATIEANGNIKIEGLCMDTAGEATASGTQVVLSTCGFSLTQVWTQSSTGSTLENQAAGLCLNVSSTANGSTADIAACSSSSQGQRWWLPAM
jgi:hypothetical protein